MSNQIDENKEKIEQANQLIVVQSEEFMISTQEQYTQASEFLKSIMDAKKKVKEYWANTKKTAHDAWKNICNKENEMLNPLETAEKNIKDKIGMWEKIQKAKAEEQKRKLEEQRQKMIEQYKNSENEDERAMAEVMENTPVVADVAFEKAKGISSQKTYDVEIIDESKVPIYVQGMEIRPINLSAIKKLATQSKGKIQIDGVKIIEKEIIKCRT